MKDNYVENFVNPKYYVNLDFDNLISYAEVEKFDYSSSIPRLLVAILMFIVMFACLINLWWVAFAFSAMLAFFSFPKTSRWIQGLLGIIFPNKFFWTVVLLLFIGVSISVNVEYKDYAQKKAEQKIALQQKLQQERDLLKKKMEEDREAELQRQQIQMQKLDKMKTHQERAELFLKKRRYNDAISEFEAALSLADAAGKSNLKPHFNYTIANLYFVQKKYGSAVGFYNRLSDASTTHGDSLRYNKAICYVKIGDIESAVNTLRSGPKTKRTEMLFEKINPVEKHLWRRNYRKQSIYEYRRKYGEW